MECRSCGRSNSADRVECEFCEALLVDVFSDDASEKTDPIQLVGGKRTGPSSTDELLQAAREQHPGIKLSGTRVAPQSIQYTGDLPRLFRFGNRYQILEKLGEGGMGRVYKALDLELDRPVALKTIRAETGNGPDVLKRFKQELILARKVTHKNVVRIYDLGEAEGMKFFTMELIHGKSLRDVLRDRKRIPVSETLSYMKQILAGLAEAHSQGVVHRDLKPQNIMVDGDGVVRIMDFGIARTVDSVTITGTGEMMGTPDYISPEQVKGETADAQSDIYSFGVILYEILTGDVPFHGDTTIAKVVSRIQSAPKLPRAINPEIPAYLERIVLKCMETDPELRYKTADDVLQDLEREQVDRSLLLRIRKMLKRHRGWVAAACLAGSLALGSWYYEKLSTASVAADVPVTTLAILPFHNMTGAEDLAWMETGIPEMLVTDISQFRTLRPVLTEHTQSILRELGKDGQRRFDQETVEVISEMTQADYALHGAFVEAEGRLRMNLSLRESGAGVSIPIRVDGASGEVFTVVDQLTEQVLSQLDLDAGSENKPLIEVSTGSLGAFRAYHQGLSLLHQGANQAAVPLFKEAVELDPQFAMAHARLAQAHFELGNRGEAELAIQRAQELAEESPLPVAERYQIHANAALVNDDPATAVEAYEKLVQLYPANPTILLGLAGALESQGRMNDALDTYSRVLSSTQSYGAALLGMGRMLVTAGRPHEAIPILEEAVEKRQFVEDLEGLGMLRSILGVAYRTTRQYERSITNFELSLDARRQIGDVQGVVASLTNVAMSYEELGRSEDALVSLKEALSTARSAQIPTMESAALLNLGNMALRDGELQEALEHYRRSLEIEWDLGQNNETAYRLNAMANVYRLRGHYAEAMVYLEQARRYLEESDDAGELAFNLSILGHIQKARGHYDSASQALLKALPELTQTDLSLDTMVAQRSLAEIYMDTGRFTEALGVIKQSMAVEHPEVNLESKLLYAQFLVRVGALVAARDELDSVAQSSAFEKFGVSPHYNLVRGLLSMEEGRPRIAERYFFDSLQHAKNRREVILTGESALALGRSLFHGGQHDEARQLLEETYSEARTYRHRTIQAEAALAISRLYLQREQTLRAEDAAREAISLAQDFEGRPLLARAALQMARIAEASGNAADQHSAVTAATHHFRWILSNVPEEFHKSMLSVSHWKTLENLIE